MKKNILFVMNNLVCGGAEKALLSLLQCFDYNKYNVDLFLFKHDGIFLKKLPREVHLLPEPEHYQYFDMPVKDAATSLLKKRKFDILFYRLMLGYFSKKERNGAVVEQKLWKYLSKAVGTPSKQYDVAIGFQEKNPIYFCVDNVTAKKKIGWIHTDYNKLGIDFKRESFYFQTLGHIVTVSEDLVRLLQQAFPNQHQKFTYIHNVVSVDMIRNMAKERINLPATKGTTLVSVGRLAKEKGLELSLQAVDLLVKKGYHIIWYVIGEGNMRSYLENEIAIRDLHNHIKLLGLQENPYPYIKAADIYIQTSRYEGKSISIDEAKILQKPIVITNFETAKDHIDDGKNGLIADMNAHDVAEKIEQFIQDQEMRKLVIHNLSEEQLGTEAEVQKLYEIIER
ncbi:glycosyltransferase [Ectobacillus antri]|uniref:glycosyltransferase n=1 Tax=Ectobacillus antri TaxID=2486280 RepID=UPI000F5B2D04|nr:glycosyltransferase [Ectobacillus antri]